MTRSDWYAAVGWGAVLGGVFWGVMFRLTTVSDHDLDKAHSILGIAVLSIVVVVVGRLAYAGTLEPRRKPFGVALMLAPLIGWPVAALYLI